MQQLICLLSDGCLLYEKPFDDFVFEKPLCWVNYFATEFVRFVLFKVASKI